MSQKGPQIEHDTRALFDPHFWDRCLRFQSSGEEKDFRATVSTFDSLANKYLAEHTLKGYAKALSVDQTFVTMLGKQQDPVCLSASAHESVDGSANDIVIRLPTVMHACIQCQTGMGGTLVWENDHYTNVASPGGISETYTVESVLTGQLSPEGNSIINGMQHWVGIPNSYHSFGAAWGSAIASVPGSRRADPIVTSPEVMLIPLLFGLMAESADSDD